MSDSNNQYKTIVELAGEAIIIIQDEKIVYANPKCSQVTGYSNKEILATPFIEFIYEEDKERVFRNFKNRIKGLPAEKEYDFRVICKDGSIKWFHIRPVIIQWNGKPAILDFLVDITERKKLEEKLKQSLVILQATIDATDDAVLVISKERKILAYNKAFLKLWDLSKEDMNTDSMSLLKKVAPKVKNSQKFVQIVEEIYKNPETVIKDKFQLKDGRVFERYSYPFKIDNQIFGRVWYSKDVTKNIMYQNKLKKLATTDSLTGLINRRKFIEFLSREIHYNSRKDRPFVLIMVDIDDFKKINDKYGHNTGDLVLKKVAKKVKNVLRKEDVFARWGGEEFLILCPDTKLEDGMIVAQRILKTINNITVNSFTVSASIGIAQYKKGDNYSQIIKRVDQAMYKAKNTGKNKVAAD